MNRPRWRRMTGNPLFVVPCILLYTVIIVVLKDAIPSARDNPRSPDAHAGVARPPSSSYDGVAPREKPEEQRSQDMKVVPKEEKPALPQGRPHYNHVVKNDAPRKGGVEVFPLQPARRKRSVSKPLEPKRATIEGVYTVWKFPETFDEEAGAGDLKGLYVLFHGCNHGPEDWFSLPEERTIVDYLHRKGYAIVAPASADRNTGCWTKGKNARDNYRVRTMLWRWYRDWSIHPETPLFLFGASSGGEMASSLGGSGGFQLCEKRTTYIRVAGILSQVSWGSWTSYSRDSPPAAFMPMPKGEPPVQPENDNVSGIFGKSHVVPQAMAEIARNIRRAGGRPRMLLLPLGELSIYSHFFSDRVFELSTEESESFMVAMREANALECSETKFIDGEPECFLKTDPRSDRLAIDTLKKTYEREGEGKSFDELTEARFQELLNVAWGAHEISADFVMLWENWMWKACADICDEWVANAGLGVALGI